MNYDPGTGKRSVANFDNTKLGSGFDITGNISEISGDSVIVSGTKVPRYTLIPSNATYQVDTVYWAKTGIDTITLYTVLPQQSTPCIKNYYLCKVK